MKIKDYISKLFKKPKKKSGISFPSKKLTSKEIVSRVKSGDYSVLGKEFEKTIKRILPSKIFGKRVTKLQSLGIHFGVLGIGLLSSFWTGNPLLFLIGLSIAFGSEYVFNDSASSYIYDVTAIDSTTIAIVYRDSGNSNQGTVIIGVISGTPADDITYGSEYVFNSGNGISNPHIDKLTSTTFVVVFTDFENTNYYPTAIIGTIANDDEISYGNKYVPANTTGVYCAISTLDSTHIAMSYRDSADGSKVKSAIGVVSSGNQIAFGSIYTALAATTYEFESTALDSTHFVVAHYDVDDGQDGKAVIGVVSAGDEIAFGSVYEYYNGASNLPSLCTIDSTHFAVTYLDQVKIATVASDDEISYGSEYVFFTDARNAVISLLDSTHIVVSYRQDTENDDGYSIVGIISDTDVVTFGDSFAFNAADTIKIASAPLSSTSFAVAYEDQGDSNKGKAIVGIYEEPTTLPIEINIADTWIEADKIQINIGDVWKDVTKVQINVGDVWKDVF